jgi:hypothetical protein
VHQRCPLRLLLSVLSQAAVSRGEQEEPCAELAAGTADEVAAIVG